MFPCACSLLSTQCAALIALAAAAGLARTESEIESSRLAADAHDAGCVVDRAPDRDQTSYAVVPSYVSPWLSPAAFASAWLLASAPSAPDTLAGILASYSGDAPPASAPVCPPPPRLRAVATPLPPGLDSLLVPVSCAHLRLPFAVGPPSRSRHVQPTAVAAFTSGNFTAETDCSEVALPSSVTVARLARCSALLSRSAGPVAAADANLPRHPPAAAWSAGALLCAHGRAVPSLSGQWPAPPSASGASHSCRTFLTS